jgi:hypothetical protein
MIHISRLTTVQGVDQILETLTVQLSSKNCRYLEEEYGPQRHTNIRVNGRGAFVPIVTLNTTHYATTEWVSATIRSTFIN